ncbi:transposase [Rhizobium sp. BUS002]|uniref:Transposase n=1 Tax=Rhizobium phaseoli TaxID=396 RepID=A0A7X6F8Q8_9HYPH|nr:transposase [Rhizobium phaseoli]QPK12509.1 transposase [Rhizobium phaseoli]
MFKPALIPNLTDAPEKMEDWRRYYNEERPHGRGGLGKATS